MPLACSHSAAAPSSCVFCFFGRGRAAMRALTAPRSSSRATARHPCPTGHASRSVNRFNNHLRRGINHLLASRHQPRASTAAAPDVLHVLLLQIMKRRSPGNWLFLTPGISLTMLSTEDLLLGSPAAMSPCAFVARTRHHTPGLSIAGVFRLRIEALPVGGLATWRIGTPERRCGAGA
jgi:hypothetical protein